MVWSGFGSGLLCRDMIAGCVPFVFHLASPTIAQIVEHFAEKIFEVTLMNGTCSVCTVES